MILILSRFASDDAFQGKIKNGTLTNQDLDFIRNIPEIKIHNKLFKNAPNLKFKDQQNFILNNKISYSNGSAYADLDNDGDLDIITTNINDKAFVYENIVPKSENNKMLTLILRGSEHNRTAIGSKLVAYKKDSTLVFEKYPTKGFQSSMETPLYAGLGNSMI